MPRCRGECEVCPTCQGERDAPTGAPLSCGHDQHQAIQRSRPCVFARCRHALEPRTGPAPAHWPKLLRQPPSCALDVADQQPAGVGQRSVAAILGVEERRVSQIEAAATRKLRDRLMDGQHEASRSAGDALRDARMRAGLSLRAAAPVVGFSALRISDIECGRASFPSTAAQRDALSRLDAYAARARPARRSVSPENA